MNEVKRKTDGVDEMIGELVAGSDAGLAIVGRAVRDVNETLAVHAAWTEERFEAVDDRLDSLARVLVMTSGKVEMQIAGIDSRLAELRGLEALRQGLAMLAEAVQGLTNRVGEVLAHAISDEMDRTRRANGSERG